MKGPLDASTALQQIRRIAVTADVADLVDQHARDRDAIAQAVLLLGGVGHGFLRQRTALPIVKTEVEHGRK